LTGTDTKPKLIAPLQITRGMVLLLAGTSARVA
jgi:hypothetical protein